MDRHASHHYLVARPVLVALVATFFLAVAASAAAAPAATVLTLSPQSAKVAWHAKLVLNGVLQEDVVPPLPLDQQTLEVQRSATSSGPWTTVGTITNTAGAYYSGAYVYSQLADETWFWRMYYAGDTQWAASTSNVVKVGVSPVLGKPKCPKVMGVAQKFRVSGSLKPAFTPGLGGVKVKVQRYTAGKWKRYATRACRVSDSGVYSKYSVRLAISTPGKYRFYAVRPGSGDYASGRSEFSRSLHVMW